MIKNNNNAQKGEGQQPSPFFLLYGLWVFEERIVALQSGINSFYPMLITLIILSIAFLFGKKIMKKKDGPDKTVDYPEDQGK